GLRRISASSLPRAVSPACSPSCRVANCWIQSARSGFSQRSAPSWLLSPHSLLEFGRTFQWFSLPLCSTEPRAHSLVQRLLPSALGIVGHLALPEQLGRNQRFASAGSLIATGLMGLIGYLLTSQAMRWAPPRTLLLVFPL